MTAENKNHIIQSILSCWKSRIFYAYLSPVQHRFSDETIAANMPLISYNTY